MSPPIVLLKAVHIFHISPFQLVASSTPFHPCGPSPTIFTQYRSKSLVHLIGLAFSRPTAVLFVVLSEKPAVDTVAWWWIFGLLENWQVKCPRGGMCCVCVLATLFGIFHGNKGISMDWVGVYGSGNGFWNVMNVLDSPRYVVGCSIKEKESMPPQHTHTCTQQNNLLGRGLWCLDDSSIGKVRWSSKLERCHLEFNPNPNNSLLGWQYKSRNDHLSTPRAQPQLQ